MKHAVVSTHLRTFFQIKVFIIIPLIVGSICLIGFGLFTAYVLNLRSHTQILSQQKSKTQQQLAKINKDYLNLKNQDQYKINLNQQATIKHIEETYTQAASLYENLVDLKIQKQDTKDLDQLFAESLNFLAQKNYSSASADLQLLASDVQSVQAKLAAATVASIPQISAPTSNVAPGGGFSQQTVTTSNGSFVVSIIAADLNSTRVIVDTASDNDCQNNCPTLPLGDYVSRSGAYAGINGTFFCPPEYPSCAGKVGSFDTLLMNKNKHYFNSANNVYSTVPLVYFSGNSMGVRTQSLNWGRDTGVDSVIAMQPLLILNGQNIYGGSGDSKFTNKGTRSFIAAKGNTVYIGVIYNADMGDSANVLKALGMDNALNLDEGGSTALWYGGYKAGPGRNIPNAVLFVKK